jgi:glutamate N-acetyltransferase/amino-acid N-acetyltransferase
MAGKDVPVSPLAPKRFPKAPPVAGVRFATGRGRHSSYKGRTRRLARSARSRARPSPASSPARNARPRRSTGVVRESAFRARRARVLVNSGNANAFTGLKGREATALSAKIAAKAIGCKPKRRSSSPRPASSASPSTPSKFRGRADEASSPGATTGDWLDAARAIMTTDTFPKVAWRRVMIEGKPVIVVGIAKGAGMIQPDMATMLSFVFTDAPISAAALQPALKKAADRTLNCVTVDGDTSTSDTLIAFATGKAAGVAPITDPKDRRAGQIRRAMTAVLHELAIYVAKDGEGARKFVTVTVTGATSSKSAKRIAQAIANSPLVKTAVAGEDANWGRVVMAVGKAGEPAERDKLAISFGDIRVAHAGARDPSYDEEAVSAYMRGDDIKIHVDLGLGRGRAHMWTCDLTKEYVAINGDYRS